MDQPAEARTLTSDFGTDRIGDAAEAISTLARVHGIVGEREAIDDFADAVSRLSDAEVSSDHVERLLVALQRAGIVDAKEAFALHVAYLRQKPGKPEPQGLPDPVTPELTEKRREAVRDALASVRIEGGETGPEARDMLDQWAQGTVGMEDVLARLRTLHARTG